VINPVIRVPELKISTYGEYIGSQTLAQKVSLVDTLENNHTKQIDMDDDVFINIRVSRV